MQTNKINGLATLALLRGEHPAQLVGLRAGGTLNHKLEAASVQVGMYLLVAPDAAQAASAIARAIELLELQIKTGHMGAEVLTDGHAPIYLRAMCSLKLWLLRSSSDIPGQSHLRSLTDQWFEHHYACLTLGLVPRGPLKGEVILPCARKTKAKKTLEVETPGNQVRNVWLQIVNGVRPRVGRRFWDLTDDRQDTAAGPISRLVIKEGGFGRDLKRGTLPRLCSPLQVERLEGGHTARFLDDLPGSAKWNSQSCWVDYESGQYSFKDDEVPPPLGRRMEISSLAKATT